MRFLLAAVSTPILLTAAIAQPIACFPPREPFMLADDVSFSEYADIVAEDFERYFAEVASYIACLDEARQQAFARAQEISEQHEAFWERAEQLGLTEEIAPDADPQ